jgi:hypothetical protein
MTTTLISIEARGQSNDLAREAKRYRRDVEVRRLAVVRPAGSHFNPRPFGADVGRRAGHGLDRCAARTSPHLINGAAKRQPRFACRPVTQPGDPGAVPSDQSRPRAPLGIAHEHSPVVANLTTLDHRGRVFTANSCSSAGSALSEGARLCVSLNPVVQPSIAVSGAAPWVSAS